MKIGRWTKKTNNSFYFSNEKQISSSFWTKKTNNSFYLSNEEQITSSFFEYSLKKGSNFEVWTQWNHYMEWSNLNKFWTVNDLDIIWTNNYLDTIWTENVLDNPNPNPKPNLNPNPNPKSSSNPISYLFKRTYITIIYVTCEQGFWGAKRPKSLRLPAWLIGAAYVISGGCFSPYDFFRSKNFALPRKHLWEDLSYISQT